MPLKIGKQKKPKQTIGRPAQSLMPIKHDPKPPIPAAVWGQLEPLDRVAAEYTAKWGDRLPGCVSTEMAGRFESAYEALRDAVSAHDVHKVAKIAPQLVRAWEALEKEALAAGHKPLPDTAYAVELGDGSICAFTCYAHDAAKLRQQHDWVVYTYDNAARLLAHAWEETILKDAFNTFPDAKVVEVRDGKRTPVGIIEDEIPF